MIDWTDGLIWHSLPSPALDSPRPNKRVAGWGGKRWVTPGYGKMVSWYPGECQFEWEWQLLMWERGIIIYKSIEIACERVVTVESWTIITSPFPHMEGKFDKSLDTSEMDESIPKDTHLG